MKCYIDADGVLVNLQAKLAQQINEDLDNGLGRYQGSREKKLKKLMSLERQEVTEQTLAQDLVAHDNKEEKTKWQKALHNYKFSVLSKESAQWWADLPAMDKFDVLIQKCQEKYGAENVFILTSPVEQSTSNCELGKREWFAQNANIEESNVIVDSNKGFYAGQDAILIDDRTKYCNAFQQAGGLAILHTSVEETIQNLP